jgi:hypothetical protein
MSYDVRENVVGSSTEKLIELFSISLMLPAALYREPYSASNRKLASEISGS